MIYCSKCSRVIKNLEVKIDDFWTPTGLEYAKVLCSYCVNTHKIVKRPIKRKLTKWEKFEVILFFLFAVVVLVGLVVWLICSLVSITKEGKWGEIFSWNLLLWFFLYVACKIWFDRVRRLEKEEKGECCNSSDCVLKDEISDED